MKTRTIAHRMAADLLIEWGDRRLPGRKEPGPIDFSLEDPCDGLCRWLADDPERDLSGVPAPLLRHLRARIAFAIAACLSKPTEAIGKVPSDAPEELVLAAILGKQLAGTRFPDEWHLQ